MATVVEFLLAGFTDNSGEPLASGKVHTYEAGTNTPKATYTDNLAQSSEQNPIILDSNGRKQVYATGSYKFVIKTAADATLYTYDNLFFGDDSDITFLGTTTGTPNAYVATPTPAESAYVDGQLYAFQANFTNTAAATLNISGLGAYPVTSYIGQIVSGFTYLVRWNDALDVFNIVNPSPGFATTEAAISALNSAGVEIVVNQSITLTGPLTLTAPLRINKGGMIVTGSNVLTINGSFSAGLYQCFDTTATKVLFGGDSVKEVYPQWFGAVADGVTDDTAEIQAAITAAGNAGGVVFFPAGTYSITELAVSSANVSLLGTGIRSTILKKSTTTTETAAITISADYCNVANLTLQGANVATYVYAERAIFIEGVSGADRVSHVTIDSVEMYDFGSDGIYSLFGEYVRVTRCKAHNVGYIGIGFWSTNYTYTAFNEVYTITPGTASNAYGIVYSHVSAGHAQLKYGVCTGNIVRDISLWEAIDTHGGTHLIISNNIIFECRRGVVVGIDIPNSYVPDYCQVCNNTIDAGSLATVDCAVIYAGIDGGTDAVGGAITGNTIINHGNTNIDFGAIYVYDTIGLLIQGNRIVNSKGVAISLYAGNTNLALIGNVIQGMQSGVANASAIIIRAGASTGLIADNVINASAEYGIYSVVSSTSLEQGRNYITTSSLKLVSTEYMGAGREIFASGTVDPVNLADGAGATYTITATGANLGDAVEFAAPYDLEGITVTAYVSIVNTVSVRVQNESGGPLDLASGTWKVKVTKL